jgi:hypothetical protein
VEIMEMMDKRLNDKGKNWRHVFKVSEHIRRPRGDPRGVSSLTLLLPGSDSARLLPACRIGERRYLLPRQHLHRQVSLGLGRRHPFPLVSLTSLQDSKGVCVRRRGREGRWSECQAEGQGHHEPAAGRGEVEGGETVAGCDARSDVGQPGGFGSEGRQRFRRPQRGREVRRPIHPSRSCDL